MIALILGKTIFSFYLIMAAGFVMQKTGIFKKNESRILSLLVLYLVMPALILSAYMIEPSPQVGKGLLLAIAASVTVYGFLLLLSSLLKKFFHFDNLERGSVIYSNCGNLIIPLVYVIFGREYVIYCTGYIMICNILVWTHGVTLLSGEKKIYFWKMIFNPNMLASWIGMLMFFSGFQLPAEINKSISLLGDCIVPLTMLVTGMLLAELDIRTVKENPRLFHVVAWRLIIAPLAVAVILHYFPFDFGAGEIKSTILTITYLSAVAPPANTVTMLAQVYGKNAVYANAVGVVGTVLCIFTMPLMVWLYQAW